MGAAHGMERSWRRGVENEAKFKAKPGERRLEVSFSLSRKERGTRQRLPDVPRKNKKV